MDRVIFIASSAAKKTLREQTVSANNLANVNTIGFKRDLTQARTYTLHGPIYPSRAYAMSLPEVQDFKSGTINTTGRTLDVAVNGDGWLAVESDVGIEAYTRAGNLQITQNGQLITAGGKPVVGNGGPIVIPPYEKLLIGHDGTISIQPAGQPANTIAIINQIKLVKPDNDLLKKNDDGLFYMQGDNQQAPPDLTVRLQTGALETSNVNGIEEMVQMIDLSRKFEVYMKMITTADEKAANTARLLQQ